MGGGRCRRSGVIRTFLRLFVVLLSASVCLSLVWDADGNPNTDNLPPVALLVGARPAADIEAEAEAEDGEETATAAGRSWLPRLARRRELVRLRRWRRLAVPPRGP
jgi:hypothetical protein